MLLLLLLEVIAAYFSRYAFQFVVYALCDARGLLMQQVPDNTKTSTHSPVIGIPQLSTHPNKPSDGKN